jgi:hypothetical protein
MVHLPHPIVVRGVAHHLMTVGFQEGGLSQEDLILSTWLLVTVMNRQNLHQLQNNIGTLYRNDSLGATTVSCLAILALTVPA